MPNFSKRDIIIYFSIVALIVVIVYVLATIHSNLYTKALEDLNSGIADRVMSGFAEDTVIYYRNNEYKFSDYKDKFKQKLERHEFYVFVDRRNNLGQLCLYRRGDEKSYPLYCSCNIDWNFFHNKINKIYFDDVAAESIFLDSETKEYITKKDLDIIYGAVGMSLKISNISTDIEGYKTIVGFDYPEDRLCVSNLHKQGAEFCYTDGQIVSNVLDDGDISEIYIVDNLHISFKGEYSNDIEILDSYVVKFKGGKCRVYLILDGIYEYKE